MYGSAFFPPALSSTSPFSNVPSYSFVPADGVIISTCSDTAPALRSS